MSSSHRDDDDDPNFALVGGEGATKKSRNSLSLLLVFVVLLAHEALDVGQRFPIGFLTKAHYCDDGTTTTTTKNPTKKGLLFASLSYLVYSYLQGQDTHMKRPHPGVWRVAHGGFVMYMLFLVFLVFQDTRETARENVFVFLDADLAADADEDPYEERTYATDCRVMTPEQPFLFQNVKNTVLDEFFVAHVLGWFGKALAIRDWHLLWAYSILFEVMEVTFMHWLKNFNECWWDSWVLDVLVCNLGGMWVGMQATKYFSSKTTGRDIHSSDSSSRGSSKGDGVVDAAAGEESESSEEDECDEEDDGKKKSPASLISRRLKHENDSNREKKKKKMMMMNRGRPSSNFVRVARKSIEDYILPEKGCNWYRYEWQPFKSPARFIQCAFLIGMCLSFELNAFFLKFIYGIPPPHILNTLRLALWFAEANIAVREYYVFITDERGIWKAKLGANAWLAIAAMAMEFLVILKHGNGLFTAEWPRAVVRFWLAVAVAIVGGLSIWQFRIKSQSGENTRKMLKPKPPKVKKN